MFKIDWPCAIGGVALGYYTKGKIETIKTRMSGICIDAAKEIKDSFQNQVAQETTKSPNGGKNGY